MIRYASDITDYFYYMVRSICWQYINYKYNLMFIYYHSNYFIILLDDDWNNEKWDHPTYWKECILYAGMQWRSIKIRILLNQRQIHINDLRNNCVNFWILKSRCSFLSGTLKSRSVRDDAHQIVYPCVFPKCPGI